MKKYLLLTLLTIFGLALLVVSCGKEDAIISAEVTPSIAVTSPVEGEICVKNYRKDILWDANFEDNVLIELLKSDVVIDTVASEVENVGRFIWLIPNTLTDGADYTIRISSDEENIQKTSRAFEVISNVAPNDAILLDLSNIFSLPDSLFETSGLLVYENEVSWYKFDLDVSKIYRFISFSDDGFDVRFMLFASDGSGELSPVDFNDLFLYQNDDDGTMNGVTHQALLDFQPPSTGMFYMRVAYWDNVPEELIDDSKQSTGGYNLFVYHPEITLYPLAEPMGYEYQIGNDSLSIKWQGNIEEEVRLSLMKTDGSGELNEIIEISSSVENDGSYDFTIPSGLSEGDLYTINVESVTETANIKIEDRLDGDFKLKLNNSFATSDSIVIPCELSKSIDYEKDLDFYKFPIKNDSIYDFHNILSHDTMLTVRFKLFDSSLDSIGFGLDSLVAFTDSAEITGGVLYLKVSSENELEVGEYLLEIQEYSPPVK
ncbi:MAG: hypothetical protein KAH33_00600 [Candidatus Delongbacteria bacterium]|nr:hypothetical protein [Candidatus Delongbacteria bacterium]